jgi:Mg-chelatase subunit ChlD
MKRFIACVILLFAVSTIRTYSQSPTGEIRGQIRDSHTHALLDYVTVKLQRNGLVIATVTSDSGFYEFKLLQPGNYTVTIANLGYETTNVPLLVHADEISFAHIQLDPSAKGLLRDVVIERKKPLVDPEGKAGGTVSYKEVMRLPSRSAHSFAGVDSRASSPGIRGGRAEGTAYYIDGVRASDRVSTRGSKAPVVPGIVAGQLTASEINDFGKWELWKDISADLLKLYRVEWKLGLKERYTVRVVNAAGRPETNVKAELINDSGVTVWESRTDNAGTAELWADADSGHAKEPYDIRVSKGNEVAMARDVTPDRQGATVRMNVHCDPSRNADIAFVVDATGSMGDEIRYLKAELRDVIEDARKMNKDIRFRLGSVFYRDHTDEYVTRISPFSEDERETIRFINDQYADGGGDGPEAVDEALEVAISGLDWSEDARTRIIFLLLDAPPHGAQDNISRMHRIMKEASAAGIRIIPIASSGTDKSCEYLMRELALATNGTYITLTDHSGIGGAHIKPTTDSYDVELLNGLLKKVIQRYCYMPSCSGHQADLTALTDTMSVRVIAKEKGDLPGGFLKAFFSKQQAKDSEVAMADTLAHQMTDTSGKPGTAATVVPEQPTEKVLLKYFPNPTTDVLNITTSRAVSLILLTDVGGKLLQEIKAEGQRDLTLDMSAYPAGNYFLRCEHKGQWLVGKVVVVR